MKLNVYSQEELLALAAANAPNPSREVVALYHDYDMKRNPLNESGKPMWRTELQILADFKLDFAKTLFERLDKRTA